MSVINQVDVLVCYVHRGARGTYASGTVAMRKADQVFTG